MVPYTGRVKKSAIFGKTLTVGHQMVPCTGRVKKSAIFGKTLTVGHQMVPYTLYRQGEEKCIFWQNFDFVPQNGPLYRQSGDKCNFGSTLTS